MNNRFGFRDLVLSALLVGIIVMIGLHMKQFERLWSKTDQFSQELEDQTRGQVRLQRDVGELARAVEQANDQGETQALTDQIRRLREAIEQIGTGEGSESLASAIEQSSPATQPNEARETSATQPGTRPAATQPGGTPEELAEMEPFPDLTQVKQKEDYARGGWLVSSFGSMPSRLTPIVSSDVYASLIQQRVLQTLATLDPNTLDWRPLIARSWQMKKNIEGWRAYVDKRMNDPLTEAEIREEDGFPADDSDEAKQQYISQRKQQGRTRAQISEEPACPTPVTVEFEIRRGVTFSDGEPLTAEDVVFTFNWIMNPAVNAPRQRAYYEKVKRVEQLDRYRVAFHFREPYFLAFTMAASLEILPEHFYSQFTPQEFNTNPGLLMGSGPYKLSDPAGWRPTPGEPITLVRNNRYWGEPPAFDRLVRRVIENDAARLTTYVNGDIDTLGATPEQYEELLDNESVMNRSNAFEFYAPEDGYMFIGWNQQRNGEDTFFADRRVRRAMTMLINRERVIEQILLGHGRIVTGPFVPSSDQYDNSIEPWSYAPQQARELLAEAGFEDRNGDGVLESSDGEPFEFDLIVPSQSNTFDRISSLVKDTLARAGVVAQIRKLEWSVMMQRMDNRNFDAITLGWGGSDLLEGDPYQIFHSSQIEGTGDNFVSYSNPELDQAIDHARRTVDRDERMQIWHKVHRILHEDQPYTFLFARQSLAFFDKRIKNVHRTRLGLTDRFLWYVPTGAQRRSD